MTHDRPNPDELLAKVARAEARQARGKLKIFFGAAPGVGKTYAMLEAARKQAKAGIDVVIGYLEPHIRPETLALALGLDMLARREISYKGTTLFEFDLERAIERHPRLLIVDELAHSNAAETGAVRHAKRWRDVVDVLNAGIDVYTTLNVQHLESLNDVVAKITGIVVRETVPDRVFDEAEEIELVDLPPDDLVERLREGKVYVAAQAGLAIQSFFRKGNLIALRELALRRTAEHVNAQVSEFRSEHSVASTWPTADRLLVCVGPSPFSARLIRATRRMAGTLRAPWIALHVETAEDSRWSNAERDRLAQNLRLAEQLGGETATLAGARLIDQVLEYARDRNVTKIIVGKSRRSPLEELFRRSFIQELIKHSGDIDVYLISGEGEDAAPTRASVRAAPPGFQWANHLKAVGVVAVCSMINGALFPYLALSNLIMVYLLGQIAISMRWGRGPSALASALSVLSFDFFFVRPYFSFAVSDTEYLFTFAIMLFTGLVISTLTARSKVQALSARRRERRTAALYSMSRELTATLDPAEIAQVAVRHIANVLDAQIVLLAPTAKKGLAPLGEGPSPVIEAEQGIARWVLEHGKPAGLGTETLPGSGALYLPLVTAQGTLGVLVIRPNPSAGILEPEQIHLLETFAGQTALALERANLAHDAQTALVRIETERLRNSLLSAISHDLRTPLATIIGATTTVLDAGEQLDETDRRELFASVREEAERLDRLVGNLLDMTRLEAGAIAVQKDWHVLEEMIGVAVRRVARLIEGRPLRVDLPIDLPLLSCDGLLIEQVLVNLLENAARHTPAGSPIDVRAGQEADQVWVEVADRGPGLPLGQESQLFERFHGVDDPQRRMGTGLGLTICKGIIELHGGTIAASNRPGGGAVFHFTLPMDQNVPRPDEAAFEKTPAGIATISD